MNKDIKFDASNHDPNQDHELVVTFGISLSTVRLLVTIAISAWFTFAAHELAFWIWGI